MLQGQVGYLTDGVRMLVASTGRQPHLTTATSTAWRASSRRPEAGHQLKPGDTGSRGTMAQFGRRRQKSA